MTGGHVPPGYVEVPQGEPYDQGPSSPDGSDIHKVRQGELHWSSGICACCDDLPICCLGCCCPCVLFGRNVEILEGRPWVGPCIIHLLLWGVVTVGCCLFTEGMITGVVASCVPCYACNYRKAIRTKYNLEEEPCGDILTHMCCHMCAICQEHRELAERTAADHGLPVVVPPPVQAMAVPASGSASPYIEFNNF